jgi:hypothetical protein
MQRAINKVSWNQRPSGHVIGPPVGASRILCPSLVVGKVDVQDLNQKIDQRYSNCEQAGQVVELHGV